MTNFILEINNLTKTFTGPDKLKIDALKGVSLTVLESEIVSLVGPSGCGKSTLLDIAAGLIEPDSGQILVGGQKGTGRRGMVSYMPQNDVLFPWRNVLDNVIIPLEVAGFNKKAAREEAKALLPVFGLDKFANSYPSSLSGGMRQRAALLRTYLNKQELILLDEPFGKLDALTRMQMQQWLLEIWQKLRGSILFVTHDVEEAILLSDRIYIMSVRPGQIIAEEKIAFSRPRDLTMIHDPAFIAVKKQILGLLREHTGKEVVEGA